MNDRYLFRGKRVDNGEWETGFLVIERYGCSDARHYITDKMTGFRTAVDPATIGQCTGLKDRNGKLVFEGDTVRIQQNGLSNLTIIGKVKFETLECGFYLHTEIDEWFDMGELGSDIEVIGTIHDTPEVKP